MFIFWGKKSYKAQIQSHFVPIQPIKGLLKLRWGQYSVIQRGTLVLLGTNTVKCRTSTVILETHTVILMGYEAILFGITVILGTW